MPQRSELRWRKSLSGIEQPPRAVSRLSWRCTASTANLPTDRIPPPGGVYRKVSDESATRTKPQAPRMLACAILGL
jgi:hypothetical protein